MPIQNVMLWTIVKKIKVVLSSILALLMLFSLCLPAFADGDNAAEPEEIVDMVAEKEAAIAASAAKAEAEAAKVNDVVDMDAKMTEDNIKDVSATSIQSQEENNVSGLSGPILALVVGVILIVLALGVVVASNKKIKAGKKARLGK
jgi:hypothetical protein